MDDFTLHVIIFLGIPLFMLIVCIIICFVYAGEIYNNGKEIVRTVAQELPKFLKSPDKYRKP